jgi:hypothetical protein
VLPANALPGVACSRFLAGHSRRKCRVYGQAPPRGISVIGRLLAGGHAYASLEAEPRALAPTLPLWQATLAAAFYQLQICTRRRGCRSSVVEHPLGKGEVVSSILTGSTTNSPQNLSRFLLSGKHCCCDRAERCGTQGDCGMHLTQKSCFVPCYCRREVPKYDQSRSNPLNSGAAEIPIDCNLRATDSGFQMMYAVRHSGPCHAYEDCARLTGAKDASQVLVRVFAWRVCGTLRICKVGWT